ncbi:hypothetical protein N431DRAFT_484273 [Stipitochalara longipes BDJ]|nr:hypothetical protein N431DRAFT_484273 [Stipitochalara longipes BDJ]
MTTRSWSILINKEAFSVHRNLHIALKFLRSTENTRSLWIGAICIDQSDQSERLHQVEMMGEIYKRAAVVLAWLGHPFDGSDEAMDLIEEIGTACMPGSNTQRRSFDTLAPYSAQVLQLFQRDYWSRVWIVQEVAMATVDPLVGCGSKWVPWSTMFFGIFELRSQFDMAKNATCDPNELSLYAVCHAAIDNYLDLDNIRWSVKHGMLHQPRRAMGIKSNVLDLLWRTSDKHSTDPRDRIYSLFGVLTPRKGGEKIASELDPDYSRSVRSVYIMVTKMVIRLDRDLEILHMRNHLPSASLPSWTPDFSSRMLTIFPPLASTPLYPYCKSLACR